MTHNGWEAVIHFPKESALNLERKSHKLLSGGMDFLYSFNFGVKMMDGNVSEVKEMLSVNLQGKMCVKPQLELLNLLSLSHRQQAADRY